MRYLATSTILVVFCSGILQAGDPHDLTAEQREEPDVCRQKDSR